MLTDREVEVSGEGGPATQATLAWPHALAVDGAAELLVGDSDRVVRVEPTEGVAETFGARTAGGLPCLAALGCAEVASPAAPGPSAVGFVPVLTQARRGVFVVGGTEPASGAPKGETWLLPFDTNQWVRYGRSYVPHTVLAATFTFAADSLVVLDETASSEARLVSIGWRAGDVTEIGRWPRHAAWDQHWLAVDRDGAVVLVSSSRAQAAHAMARIELRGPSATVEAIDTGVGSVLTAPLVDTVGRTLLVRDTSNPTSGFAVRTLRTRGWTQAAHSLAELGDQL